MKRFTLSLLPTGLGALLFMIGGNESRREVSVVALEFMLLVLFAVLTVSWVRRLVKHPFVSLALKAMGIVNVALGLYTYYRLRDPVLSFPFFLMASYSLFRA